MLVKTATILRAAGLGLIVALVAGHCGGIDARRHQHE